MSLPRCSKGTRRKWSEGKGLVLPAIL